MQVYGQDANNPGVIGRSTKSHGVSAESTDGYGVHSRSLNAVGVVGDTASQFSAVWGHNMGAGPGVLGSSDQGGTGVRGQGGWGVHGSSNDSTGVLGQTITGIGVHGEVVGDSDSSRAIGVFGTSKNNAGVYGTSGSRTGVGGVTGVHYRRGTGVLGESAAGFGVYGISSEADGTPAGAGVCGVSSAPYQHPSGLYLAGVYGINNNTGPGVVGENHERGGPGVLGIGATSREAKDRTGVKGISRAPEGVGVMGVGGDPGSVGVHGSGEKYAGYFEGDVHVTGTITGNIAFQIDHPLDSANMYLNHASVESSERKNVYDGVAQLDEDGAAWVDLPQWFESLNEDFRYQLTPVGSAAPNLHVAEEIYENRFKIAGGEGVMKVCWQVTGTRKDPWAAANPFEVEQEKPQDERGRYRQPDLYDAPEEQRVRITTVDEEKLLERIRQEPPQEPPQAPEMPTSFEPPQAPEVPTGYDLVRQHKEHREQIEKQRRDRMEEEQQRQIDELRGQLEEQRRGRLEEEIAELRGQIKKLRRRRKR